jgi:hypothetical protein
LFSRSILQNYYNPHMAQNELVTVYQGVPDSNIKKALTFDTVSGLWVYDKLKIPNRFRDEVHVTHLRAEAAYFGLTAVFDVFGSELALVEGKVSSETAHHRKLRAGIPFPVDLIWFLKQPAPQGLILHEAVNYFNDIKVFSNFFQSFSPEVAYEMLSQKEFPE